MKTLKMVYAGMRLHTGLKSELKKTHLYFKVNEDGSLGEKANFKVQIYACTPGTVFTIDSSDDENTVYNNTAKYSGVWDNKEDVAVWQAEQKACNFILMGHQQAKRPGDVDEAIATLRTGYKYMDATHRRYFMAWLNYEITK